MGINMYHGAPHLVPTPVGPLRASSWELFVIDLLTFLLPGPHPPAKPAITAQAPVCILLSGHPFSTQSG